MKSTIQQILVAYTGRFFAPLLFVLVTLAAWLLANLINLLLGDQLTIPTAKALASTRIITAQTELGRQDLVSVILERNIFNSRPTRPTLVPEAAVDELPELKLRLIGTVVGELPSSFAIIEDLTSREQQLYRLEDVVPQGAKLVKIERNEIVLQRGSHKETLSVYLEEPSPKEVQAKGIRSVAQNSWVLDKQEVAGALENISRLLTQARLIPNFTAGRPDGFRIVNIIPRSFYDKIGLQNGDVLQRLNGIEIKDPQSFLVVFQQLKEENNFSLDLVRNNSKETFQYEIR
jgi:general secretion pathway protein C